MRYEEIIVTLEGSGYLFLLFAWRTRAMTAAMSMQNWKIPSHVTSIPVTPSRLRLGAKKHHPRKNRGEPPTGALLAAPKTAYHTIRQIASKKRGVSCGNAVIRPARESVWQAEIYLSPDFRIISFRIIPKSNTTAANTPQVNIPVYQGADCIAYSPGCVL